MEGNEYKNEWQDENLDFNDNLQEILNPIQIIPRSQDQLPESDNFIDNLSRQMLSII